MNHTDKQNKDFELRTYKLNPNTIVTIRGSDKEYSLSAMGDDFLEADASSEEIATLICKGKVAEYFGVKAHDVTFSLAEWTILDRLCDANNRPIHIGDRLSFVDGPTERSGKVTEIIHSRYVILDFVDGIDVGKDGEQYVIVTAPAEEDSK
jgi:hypothetical protein